MRNLIAPRLRLAVLPLLVSALALEFTPTTARADELDTLKSNTDRWIEIRTRLSREKNQWEANREILNNSIETLNASKEALENELQLHSLKTKELDKETALANKKLASFQRSNDLLLSEISNYESRVKRLVDRLPPPLVEQLHALLLKLPASSESASSLPAPNRVQNLVSILATIDEFNNKVTLAHTIKTLDNGEVIDVRVLYWGLAAGFATNANGTQAWVLRPGDSSWSWQRADENAPAVAQLFKVYDKDVDPVLVDVPFQLSAESLAP